MGKKENTYAIIDETSEVEPMVSVSMLTYNHQDFIAEAIESVMKQETSFDVVLVIAEDCSSDNTREIILDYQKRFPKRIKLILQNNNVGAAKNSSSIVENLNGKYIAFCEGDDYWIEPLKLQKQIDFLEKKQNYSAVSHHRYINQNGTLTKEESGKNVFTQCLVFRNDLSKSDYDLIASVFNSDSFLELILEIRGNIGYLNFYGAAYRFNFLGLYSSLNMIERYVKAQESLLKMKIYLTKFEKSKKNKNLYVKITNSINWIIVFNSFHKENFSNGSKFIYFFRNYTNNNIIRTIKDFFKLIISLTPKFVQDKIKIFIPLPENISTYN